MRTATLSLIALTLAAPGQARADSWTGTCAEAPRAIREYMRALPGTWTANTSTPPWEQPVPGCQQRSATSWTLRAGGGGAVTGTGSRVVSEARPPNCERSGTVVVRISPQTERTQDGCQVELAVEIVEDGRETVESGIDMVDPHTMLLDGLTVFRRVRQ